jgi:hypothetical protein
MAFTPGLQQKRDVLRHLRYEIEGVFRPVFDSKRATELCGAEFEAFLVHARNMLGFYEEAKRYKDDVIPADFGFEGQPLTVSEEFRERINKELSHLTYSRTERRKPVWYLDSCVGQLLERSVAFAQHLLAGELVVGEEREHWEALKKDLARWAVEKSGADRMRLGLTF